MITIEFGMQLHVVERIVILSTLADKKGNRTHTAKELGIGIRTLQRKIHKYRALGLTNETHEHQSSVTVQPGMS